MVLKASHLYRPLRSSTQKPLEDCYGFPPPPSALRQTAVAITTKASPHMLASPSPSPSTASPSPTPSLRSAHRHQCLMHDAESQRGSNLADYLAKNPNMKRLYNNHGSIKRPACGKLICPPLFETSVNVFSVKCHVTSLGKSANSNGLAHDA